MGWTAVKWQSLLGIWSSYLVQTVLPGYDLSFLLRLFQIEDPVAPLFSGQTGLTSESGLLYISNGKGQ